VVIFSGYWPPELAETMNGLRLSPHVIDPDQLIRLFVSNAPEVDQTKDKRLWMHRILYMVRPVAQVVDSQWAMLALQGKMPKSEKTRLTKTQEHRSLHPRSPQKKRPHRAA
jgi:hypothetical protein